MPTVKNSATTSAPPRPLRPAGTEAPAFSMLAMRAAALRDFNVLPDDALVGFVEIGLLQGRDSNAVRQAYYSGKLNLRSVPGVGRSLRFRVGAVRALLRGDVEVA